MAAQDPRQLTPNVNGQVRLQSPVLNDKTRFKVVKDSKHESEMQAKLVDRNSPILVQRVDIVETGIAPGPLRQSGLDGRSTIYAEPRDMDLSARPSPNETLEAPRSTLIAAEPAGKPDIAGAIGEITGQKLGKKVKLALKAAEEAPKPKSKRIKVQFVGKAFGKTTVFCQHVAVSETVIAIGYNLASESAIVEPPRANAEDELMVKVTDPETDEVSTYQVLSGEFTFEADGIMWVVLIKVTPEDTADK